MQGWFFLVLRLAVCSLLCRQAQMLGIMARMSLRCRQSQMLGIMAGMFQKDTYAVGWIDW